MLHRIRTGLGWGLFGLLAFCAAAGVWRRLDGSLVHSPRPAALAAAALVLAGLAAGFRLLVRPAGRTVWLPSVLLVAIGLALTTLDGPLLGEAAFWAIAVAAEFFSLNPGRGTKSPSPCVAPPPPAFPNSDPSVITQEFVRSHSTDGFDTIRGRLRIDVLPGQRQGQEHLTFCPPFSEPPELELEQTSGPDAAIRVDQSLAFGARIEWKLAKQAVEADAIELEFFAIAAESRQRESNGSKA